MAFSFVEIEENKSRVVVVVFAFIIAFYFLTVYILLIVLENTLFNYVNFSEARGFFQPPLNHVLVALLLAFIAGFVHWSVSINNLIDKMSLAAGALPIDPQDIYHQCLQNIVDEVSVAAGGIRVKAMVIPSAGLNAFSLLDFDKNAVIGVTEGLLARLNRAQLEAVVAHEAGHIASGGSLIATTVASLSEFYQECLSKVKAGLTNIRVRAGLPLVLIFFILSIMNFLSMLLRCFLSRQREYLADAIAVRLTRDPLSLAEALKLISKNWRGSGAKGQKLESIFIVNPRFDSLDEKSGVAPDLFSTHPPIQNRISILLNMAHMDEETLEENLKKFKKVSSLAVPESYPVKSLPAAPGPKKWFVLKDKGWLGPFSVTEFFSLEGLRFDQWVKLEGADAVMPAYEDEDLRKLFMERTEIASKEKYCCPHCKTSLADVSYEGALILKCLLCEGAFVEQDKITRVFLRQDMQFSEDIVRLAKAIADSPGKLRLYDGDARSIWVIDCPKCLRKMRRQFFVYSYPVEIDRCFNCSGVWFDKHELEVLQYIFEHKEQFLYLDKF